MTVTVTLTGESTKLRLSNSETGTERWILTNLVGWFSQNVRTNVEERNDADGAHAPGQSFRSAKVLQLQGVVTSTTAMGAFYDYLNTITAVVGRGFDMELRYQDSDYGIDQVMAVRASGSIDPQPISPVAARFTLPLVAIEPRKFSYAKRSVSTTLLGVQPVGAGLVFPLFATSGTVSSVTNQHPNPKAATDLVGYTRVGEVTADRFLNGPLGPTGVRTTFTANTADISGVNILGGTTANVPVGTWVVSLDVYSPTAMSLRIMRGNTELATAGLLFDLVAGVPKRVEVTVTSTGGTNNLLYVSRQVAATSGYFDITAVNVSEESADFDGDTQDGVSSTDWLGTPNASVSRRMTASSAGKLDYGPQVSFGNAEITNNGTADIYPVFTVGGGAMVGGFEIAQRGTSRLLSYVSSITAAETITIDMEDKRALGNGQNDLTNNLVVASNMRIAPGETASYSLRALGATGGTPRLTVTTRDAWW